MRISDWSSDVCSSDLDQNTLVFYTTDNGAWQDVYPDAGYTPFRGTKGTVREGGNRVPAIAWMPGRIEANSKNHDILGGLRSEEHTSLQSLMRISYAVFCLKKKRPKEQIIIRPTH